MSASVVSVCAQAYCNVYGDSLHETLIDNLLNLPYDRLRHALSLFSFHMSPKTVSGVALVLAQWLQNNAVKLDGFESLVRVLVEKKCIQSLDLVLKEIVRIYNKRHNRLECTIISAQPLSDALKVVLAHRFAQATQRHIIPRFRLDKRLIGGVQIISEEFVWDCSMRTILRKLAAY